jgi:hypothetical protein
VLKKNMTCAYCGRLFSASILRTREHVIARKFVPPGTIKANDWNLILGACTTCNNGKSQLEDEISAITLYPEIGHKHSDPDLHLIAAQKAAGATSRATGKKVVDSLGRTDMAFRLGPEATMKFSFVAPPILRNDAVLELAGAHVQAFFYYLTYVEELKTGRFLSAQFLWSSWTRSLDWGNSNLSWFTNETKGWPSMFAGVAAQGFFRIKLTRKASDSQLGSFALEWNRSLRIVGFFGSQDEFDVISNTLPRETEELTDSHLRLRQEIALDPANDILFAL